MPYWLSGPTSNLQHLPIFGGPADFRWTCSSVEYLPSTPLRALSWASILSNLDQQIPLKEAA